MNRRQFLLFSAAALSAVRGAAATAPALTLPLWPDQPPGGERLRLAGFHKAH